jgi:hypothetical protein
MDNNAYVCLTAVNLPVISLWLGRLGGTKQGLSLEGFSEEPCGKKYAI